VSIDRTHISWRIGALSRRPCMVTVRGRASPIAAQAAALTCRSRVHGQRTERHTERSRRSPDFERRTNTSACTRAGVQEHFQVVHVRFDFVAAQAPSGQDVCVARVAEKSRSVWPFFIYGVLAGLIVLFGIPSLYAFGAGYFGFFVVPATLHFVVAPVLLFGLIVFLWKFISRRV
jgi:hypothetical protein